MKSFKLIYEFYIEGATYLGRLATLDIAIGEVNYSTSATEASEISSEVNPLSTECLDLSGQRVASTAKGVLVKRTVLSDGSVKVVKEIAK